MSEPIPNDKIVAQGLARLTSAYSTKPNIRALLAAYLQPAQDLEDAIWGVLRARALANAILYSPPQTNAVLDVLGGMVGQGRNGMSDAAYKSLIYLRIAVNRATGAATDWSNFAQILLRTASGPAIFYDDQAGIYFGVWGMTLSPNIVGGLLAQATPNGVGGDFAYTTWPDGGDVAWTSSYDATAGQTSWGSVYDPTAGGVPVAAWPL